MAVGKEEQQLIKRLTELADKAGQRDIVTFSDFLNLYEQNILHNLEGKLRPVRVELSGGYEYAERQIAAFTPDALSYHWEYPLACVRIEPLNPKFSDALTHRDYLGAILNLGIDRGKTGDILVEGNTAFVFCIQSMSDFLVRELFRVKHTDVRVQPVEGAQIDYRPDFKEVTGTVASVRLDALLSLAFGTSRSRISELPKKGIVFVDGRLETSGHYEPREGQLISVRGMGRFRVQEIGGNTKKGRQYVTLQKYV